MPRQIVTLAFSATLTAFFWPIAPLAQDGAGEAGADMAADAEADGISGYRFAEDFTDLQVVNAVGEEIGEISRIIIRENEVTHAVVSIGGFVGLGGSDVVLPFDVFRFDGERATIDTLASADQIEGLTVFDPGAFGLSD